MINTLIDTQPMDAGSSGGKTSEVEVRDKLVKQMLPDLPLDWNEVEVDKRIKSMKGPKLITEVGLRVPLNVFLYQEMTRFQKILISVRATMKNIILAVDGAIIMTLDIVSAIGSIFDLRVPKSWWYDPTRSEISWLTPTLGGWIEGLKSRYNQLNTLYITGRPVSFWFTGFFNPQGFLTGMKHKVTRTKKGAWSLDEVEYKTDFISDVINTDNGILDRNLAPASDGVLVHGLYIEGATLSKKGGGKLEDLRPNKLYSRFPIMNVSAQSTAIADTMGGEKLRREDSNKTNFTYSVYK